MRYVALTLIGTMLFAVTAVGQDTDADKAKAKAEKAFKSYAELAVGGVWKSTVNVTERDEETNERKPTGEVNQNQSQYRWVGDKKFLVLMGASNGERGDRIRVLGVDPKTNQFTWWSFRPRGVGKMGCTQEEDGSWDFKGTLTNDDGQQVEWHHRLRKLSNNELIYEPVSVTVDGQPLEKATLRPPTKWTRHEGTIDNLPLAEVEAEEEEATEVTAGHKALQAYGEFAVGGVWKTTEEETEFDGAQFKPTGEKVDLVHKYEWFAGNTLLRLSGTSNGEKLDAVMVFGVDPITEKMTWWTFGKDGLGVSTLTLRDNNSLLAEGVFKNEQGVDGHWKAKLEMVGEDEIRLTGIEMVVGGNSVPVPETTSVWKRHKE